MAQKQAHWLQIRGDLHRGVPNALEHGTKSVMANKWGVSYIHLAV